MPRSRRMTSWKPSMAQAVKVSCATCRSQGGIW